MTAGAFGALGVTIRALADEGDEVIFLSPPWFFYELMIASAGATRRPRATRAARLRPRSRGDRRRDHAADARRHRQQPAQPDRVGSIGEPELARARRCACARRPSATAGRSCCSLTSRTTASSSTASSSGRPALDYDATVTIYTYGKTTLAPGQRIGYAALLADFPDRAAFGYRVFVQQLAAGWGFPNALLQHAISDLETAVDRHRCAPGAPRPDGAGPARDGLRGHRTRGHVLSDGRARPTPTTSRSSTRLAELGALVLPGTIVGVARLVPDLADRQRRRWSRTVCTSSARLDCRLADVDSCHHGPETGDDP